jgi:hypothetical protein
VQGRRGLLARRFQIAIIIVAHPTGLGGRVASVDGASLYDINGGAVWNYKADLGVIVWADDVLSPDRWVKVAKSKDFIRFGQPGTVRKRFRCSAFHLFRHWALRERRARQQCRDDTARRRAVFF